MFRSYEENMFLTESNCVSFLTSSVLEVGVVLSWLAPRSCGHCCLMNYGLHLSKLLEILMIYVVIYVLRLSAVDVLYLYTLQQFL